MYTSNKITVTSSGWTEITANHDILSWSVYPIDGDILVQIKNPTGYGDSIFGYEGISMGDRYSALSIRVKAVSDDTEVAYYLGGQ